MERSHFFSFHFHLAGTWRERRRNERKKPTRGNEFTTIESVLLETELLIGVTKDRYSGAMSVDRTYQFPPVSRDRRMDGRTSIVRTKPLHYKGLRTDIMFSNKLSDLHKCTSDCRGD